MNLTDPTFQDDANARKWLEAQIWPNGPVCPHCGNTDASKIKALEGKTTRAGLFKCNECREQFTVTVGTVMERSKIPLRKWAMAMFVMAAAKKGVSAHQMHRTLDVPYKTAWFLMHRIREAMKDTDLAPLGGEGKIIESDEAYWGGKDVETDPKMKTRRRGKPGPGGKARIMTLVERGGRARSIKMDDLTNESMKRVLLENADRKSRLMTDEGTSPSTGLLFASHETVKHGAKEYARGDVTTNTVEGFFSVFKRGMRGTYQHCAEKHLQRYLYEFDFRYNNRTALGVNDTQRTSELAKGALGKRLMYKDVTAKN
jgi:transposase-like protein